eukprot:PhM_4_TR16386/c0_g1_i1/m.32452
MDDVERMMQKISHEIHLMKTAAEFDDAATEHDNENDNDECDDVELSPPVRWESPRNVSPQHTTAKSTATSVATELESLGVIDELSSNLERLEVGRLWEAAPAWVRTLLDRARQRVSLEQLRTLCFESNNNDNDDNNNNQKSVGSRGSSSNNNARQPYCDLVESTRHLQRQVNTIKLARTTSSTGTNAQHQYYLEASATTTAAASQEARRWAVDFLTALQSGHHPIAGSEFLCMDGDERAKVFDGMAVPKVRRGAILHHVPKLL